MASMTRINSSSHRKRRTRRNRWLPSIPTILISDPENYVNEQIERDRMSEQIAARILVKALRWRCHLPAPDFSLCLFLIPERVAINVDGLSLDKFIEHQVVKRGWIVEKFVKTQLLGKD